MAEYKLTPTEIVIRTADGFSFPPGHRFHDEYLAWVAAGNVADPYEPPPSDDKAQGSVIAQTLQDALRRIDALEAGVPPTKPGLMDH